MNEAGTGKGIHRHACALDEPVPSALERVARAAADRARRPAVAALQVGLIGFVGMVVGLVVIGELVTRLGLLHGLRNWDEHLNRTLAARRTHDWSSLSSEGSGAAETLPIVVGGLLVEAVLAVRRRWHDLLLPAIALLLEITTFLAVNEIVRRPRPQVVRLGSLPKTFSFPSGHIAATVVLYGCVAIFVSRAVQSKVVTVVAWLVVVVAAVAVGSARVYRGMHHFTDVVAGATMGIGCLLVAIVASRAFAVAAAVRVPAPATERDAVQISEATA